MVSQDSYSPEEAQKRFEALPPEIRAIMYSPETLVAVKQIGEKHKLHIDQIGLLQTEVSATMLGFTETEDLPKMLEENLNISSEEAKGIAKDIDEVLFSKIREAMKKADAAPSATHKDASVVMPSAVKMSPPTPTPATTPAPARVVPVSTFTPPTPAASSAPKPATAASAPVTSAPAKPTVPAIHAADIMLSEPTVSMPPAAAPKPITPPAAPVPNPTSSPATPATTPNPEVKVDASKSVPAYKADPYREPPE